MKKEIFIFGNGGNSKIIYEIIKHDYKLGGYIVSEKKQKINSKKKGKIFLENEIRNINIKNLVFAIGENITRYELSKKYFKNKYKFPNIIHKSAIISETATLGYGNIIMPNVVINANANVDNFCIINTSSIIEHDTNINSYSSISPNAVVCGNCNIGEGVFIGANATLIHNINVKNWSVIAAGSVITKNISSKRLFAGNPAKEIKKINKNFKVL